MEYSDILDKIKRDEIWVDVETVAKLKNVTNRAVKTFKKEDLLSVLENDSFDLDLFLKQLDSQKMIKEIGINMYAFIGDLEKKLNKNHIKVNPNVNKWLSVNFKGDIKNINFNKINPVTFFDDETYGKIYEEANDERDVLIQ